MIRPPYDPRRCRPIVPAFSSVEVLDAMKRAHASDLVLGRYVLGEKRVGWCLGRPLNTTPDIVGVWKKLDEVMEFLQAREDDDDA